MKVIIKFALVGGLGFITDIAILTIMLQLGAGAIYGRVISFSCAVLLTFFLNRRITFQSIGPIPNQLFSYLSASFIGLLVNWFVYYFGLSFTSAQVSLGIASAVAMIFNFVLYRYAVFKPPKQPPPKP